jgi:hypothetical protein
LDTGLVYPEFWLQAFHRFHFDDDEALDDDVDPMVADRNIPVFDCDAALRLDAQALSL